MVAGVQGPLVQLKVTSVQYAEVRLFPLSSLVVLVRSYKTRGIVLGGGLPKPVVLRKSILDPPSPVKRMT